MPHIHEKIDFTATVFVVHNNKVLLRKHEKYGIWLGVGGHIELDEDPNQAAIRETKEEVGLDIVLVPDKEVTAIERAGYKELVPPAYLNIHDIHDTHQHVDMVFFAKSTTDNVIPENSDDAWKWLTTEEILDPKYELLERIKIYATRALEICSE